MERVCSIKKGLVTMICLTDLVIWVYSWSKADRYYTFCTPECTAAIDAYLNYRKGEELKGKSPLIREQFNIANPFAVKAPKFLSQRMMSYVIEDEWWTNGNINLSYDTGYRDLIYSASRILTPSYIFNQDIERHIEDLSAKASRTLTKQEIQHRNIEKTLELQRRIIEGR